MINCYRMFLESKKNKFPNIKTIVLDNYVVLIGRDSVSNDHLTTIMADPDDMWFHVKGVPGSHIIIRSKDKLVTLEIKKQVAKLAVENSKIKEGKAIVVCCKAKFVKKTSEMNPGQVRVDYKNAEEIEVEI